MYKALIVCNSTYPEDPASLPELQGPSVDGLTMWNALTDATTGSFSAVHVQVLFERTSVEVSKAVEGFFSEAEPGDVLLFYFSGHGKRAGRELVLCSRDTILTHLRSSGVPCDEVSKMITESHADAIIVILDCCYSGAFKGDEIAHDLAGRGRYVLAATSPTELADDSRQKGLPSPFTAAIAKGLSGEADASTEGYVDLDDVYHYIDRTLRAKGRYPQRDFDGSGSIRIGRQARVGDKPLRQDDNEDSTTSTRHDVRLSGEKIEASQPSRITVGAPNIRLRSKDDYSLSDMRVWFACLLLSAIGAIFSLIAFRSWDTKTVETADGFRDIPDPLRYFSLAALAVAVLIFVLSLAEGSRLRFRQPASRRRALETLDSRLVRLVRRGRAIFAYAGGVLVLTPFADVESDHPSWSIALAALGAICLISAFADAHYGDVSYLAGSVLVLTAVFLPMQRSGGDWQTGLESFPGVILLLLAGFMVGAWLLKATTAVLIILSIVSGLVVLNFFNSGSPVVGPYVALVGALLAFLAVLLGGGTPLDSVAPSTSRQVARSPY